MSSGGVVAAAAAVEAAEDVDDTWLYGEQEGEAEPESDAQSQPEPQKPVEEVTEPQSQSTPVETFEEGGDPDENDTANDDAHFNDEHFEDNDQGPEDANGDSQENDDSDSDDSEDGVKVILGDTKSAPQTYPSLNIKRGGLIVQSGIEKPKHAGKFTIDDFEAVGAINGVPAQEFNIDVLEDKPWRKPGADLTDYFNYGFNEDTWRAYCERQKRMRIHESGAGLIPLGGNSITGIQQPRHPTPILNDNSKYSVGFTGARKAGPPPGRKLTGPIDVIGGRREGNGPLEENSDQMKPTMQIPVRENTIQVMTADRREYSRNKPFPDMSLPPPGSMAPPPGDFFHNPPDQQFYPPPYQEDSWGNKGGWAPSDIKELTPGMMGGPMGPISHMGMGPMGPGMGPPPGMPQHSHIMSGPPSGPPPSYGPPHMHMHHRDMDLRDRDMSSHRDDGDDGRDKDDHETSDSRDRNRDRDRERDRDRSRSSKPDRQREKSHRRDRSRSRSRRHKSRSRSPSSRHRSKKKSHRKDKEDSD